MLQMKFKTSPRRAEATWTTFTAFAEHLGALCGGCWDSKKGGGECFIEPHRDCDCGALPTISRISPKLRGRLLAWFEGRKIPVTWKHGW